MVEPLPLVPATWITGGRLRWGWPSASRMRHMRSSERSISRGCNPRRRATMDSMGVMLNAIDLFDVTPAKAEIHRAIHFGLWNMGLRFCGDDSSGARTRGGRAAHTLTGSDESSPGAGRSAAAGAGSFAGALVRSRHRLASTAHSWWRWT